MEMSGQLHAPNALSPGNSDWYPLYRRLDGPQGVSGRCWEGLPQPIIEPQPLGCPARSRVAIPTEHWVNYKLEQKLLRHVIHSSRVFNVSAVQFLSPVYILVSHIALPWYRGILESLAVDCLILNQVMMKLKHVKSIFQLHFSRPDFRSLVTSRIAVPFYFLCGDMVRWIWIMTTLGTILNFRSLIEILQTHIKRSVSHRFLLV
jgi:hypothetical protein